MEHYGKVDAVAVDYDHTPATLVSIVIVFTAVSSESTTAVTPSPIVIICPPFLFQILFPFLLFEIMVAIHMRHLHFSHSISSFYPPPIVIGCRCQLFLLYQMNLD